VAHSNPRVRKALANRPSDSSRSTTDGSGRSLSIALAARCSRRSTCWAGHLLRKPLARDLARCSRELLGPKF
jgi:hypothetical protein